MQAPGGLGPVLFGGFEKLCHCKVRVQAVGDAAQMVSTLQLERARGREETDVLVGIDQTLWPAIKPLAVDLGVRFKAVPEVMGLDLGFVPLDWGVMSLMTDVTVGSKSAVRTVSWSDLAGEAFKKKFIIQDPRTSTPGLGFVWGALAVLGTEKAPGYFAALSSRWLTLATGWSGSYGLFLRGEAPWVWSYTTSQAYHRSKGEGARYRAVLFDEGNPLQVEGAAAVRKSELVRKFLEYMISRPVQEQIPLRQWMYPALKGVALPEAFNGLPRPRRLLRWDPSIAPAKLVSQWESWIRQ